MIKKMNSMRTLMFFILIDVEKSMSGGSQVED